MGNATVANLGAVQKGLDDNATNLKLMQTLLDGLAVVHSSKQVTS